jgi:hypothetical protein
VLADGKGSLSPPPTMSERMEAALGLCQLKADVPPRPRADLVVALVGKALVDFMQLYFSDQDNFIKNKGERPPLLPYKYYAERFKVALKDLQANLPANATAARQQLQAVEKAAAPVLDSIRNRKRIADAAREPLKEAVKNLPPPNPAVYEGQQQPQIDLGPWPPVTG